MRIVAERDDKIIMIAEVISEEMGLDRLADVTASGHPGVTASDHPTVVNEILGWVTANRRAELILSGFSQDDRRQIVDDALNRIRGAISKYSSLAKDPNDYFWFMVKKVHGKKRRNQLQKLSISIAEQAEQEAQVAA